MAHMTRLVEIVWKCIGICITAILLVTAVVWGYKMHPTDAPCASLEYIIEDQDERMYLTESELNQLLRSEDIYPVGRQLNSISLHRIERVVAMHPMVRTAECYLTPRNEVKVCLTQRVPLLRVSTQTETYFVDMDRRVMQARASVRDSVLSATGLIGVQTATTQLADFAEWLQDNRYWRARVHHVQLRSPKTACLYLRDEQMPRIVLGSLHGYERKLAKLRTFLENSAEAMQDKQYNELDIRFRGQVIGRK